jgi:hypothetical protein
MMNPILAIPVSWCLAGASVGICVGMLYYARGNEFRVPLEDSIPLAFFGCLAGGVIGSLASVVHWRMPQLRSVVAAISVGALGGGIGGILGWLAGDVTWRPGRDHDRLAHPGMAVGALCGCVAGAWSGAVNARRPRAGIDEEALPYFLRSTSPTEEAEKRTNDENHICRPDQAATQRFSEGQRSRTSGSYTQRKNSGDDCWNSE